MTPEQMDEIFAQPLTGDYDDDSPWNAVRTLQTTGTREVFERAADWCGSKEPLKRARGLDILAQLGKTVEHTQKRMYVIGQLSAWACKGNRIRKKFGTV